MKSDNSVQAGDNEADNNEDIVNKCKDAEEETPRCW